ncbi:hypothetical protein EWM64_g8140 [Hericium alpestre]|uniref:Rho termination factor N-terminal domain-containing protein n=1 Tax=Hericium alpestre TaxID=135208 RepID=A0A4Y9ZM63_9AGAM|nr:hypothetical protein EWM64_g8140 [Hericium alpestre]
MSTTAGLAQAQDLSKLTVPQLKALCKDRKLTGYSKLGKAALLVKLGGNGGNAPAPAAASPPQPVQTADSVSLATTTSDTHVDPNSSLSSPADDASLQPCRSAAITPLSPNPISGRPTGDEDSPRASATNAETNASPDVSSGPVSTQEHVTTPETMPALTIVAQVLSTSQKQPSSQASSAVPKKRPPPPSNSKPSAERAQKKAKTAASNPPKSAPRIQSTSEASQKSVVPAVFKVPAVPQRKAPASAPLSLQPNQSPQGSLPGLGQASKQSQSLTAPGQRFKPLMIKKANNIVGPCAPAAPAIVKEQTSAPAVPCYLEFSSRPFSVPLQPLSMPPSLSQRKHVQRWAVILSGNAPADRKACALASKTFRYAVYLSAGERLSQDFSGRRSALMRMQYSSVQVNMWPYLRYREQETEQWKHFFEATFLGQFYRGFAPIASRLWSSPDHERQLTIAVRFVLTRLWFTICIGTSKPGWLCDTVVDAQEIIPGEIWTITVRPDSRKSNTESFYVLEETCEVIGRPEVADSEGVRLFSNDLPVRADWSQYIDKRIVPDGPRVTPLASLLAHLKWASQGEYERGISRHWLGRMAGKADEGKALRIVAERYVLACVVGNSVSGTWMSASQMAQDFAGLSERTAGGKTRQPQLSMFLPAHHHVESIHFSTADGRPLHSAVAVVQTLGREYFILKDNGMQIGCEEDGVSDVWRGILGCDYSGREVGMGTLRLAQLVDRIRKSP